MNKPDFEVRVTFVCDYCKETIEQDITNDRYCLDEIALECHKCYRTMEWSL